MFFAKCDYFIQQITLNVIDKGMPKSRSGAPARAIVNVIRNQQTPEFRNEPYRKNITENVESGTEIFQVGAQDKDKEVRISVDQ